MLTWACAQSKFYELQNRKLVEELRALRENWGKETQRIRRLYDAELGGLRQKLEEAENQKGILEVKLELIEAELAGKRDRYSHSSHLSLSLSTFMQIRVFA